jgi:hypothetical protein
VHGCDAHRAFRSPRKMGGAYGPTPSSSRRGPRPGDRACSPPLHGSGVQERLLHRVQLALAGQRLHGRHAPAVCLREVVEVTRRLLAMERVTYEGMFVHVNEGSCRNQRCRAITFPWGLEQVAAGATVLCLAGQ